MGRSVSYLNNAEVVLYFPFEDDKDENGEYDEDLARIFFSDMIDNLICEIKSKLPSYQDVSKDRLWDGRESHIILQNNLCNIGISEYCGLVSLSVAPRSELNYYGSEGQYKENFAVPHANAIRKTLEKCLDNIGMNRLYKQGTFSNGESFYQSVK